MSAWGARRSDAGREYGAGREYRGYRDDFGDGSDHYYDDDAYYDESYDDDGYYDDGGYYDEPRRAGFAVRAGRVVSGVFAGAVLVLAVVVGVAHYLGEERGFPGPGSTSVASHAVAAVVVVLAQLTADRKRGLASLSAAAVVIFTASILLFTQWWG